MLAVCFKLQSKRLLLYEKRDFSGNHLFRLTTSGWRVITELLEGGPLTEPPLPPEPTAHKAGSQAKVEVLKDRVRNQHQLWHPEDNQELARVQKAHCDLLSKMIPLPRARGKKQDY